MDTRILCSYDQDRQQKQQDSQVQPVPARWWHCTKPLSTPVPLSCCAALVKSAAMIGILLMEAPGKHHKIIKSKVSFVPTLHVCNMSHPMTVNPHAHIREKA